MQISNMKERMKEITDDLEKGIREVFESGRYDAYLRTMSRFHGYSMNNTLLIYMQKPDATLIAGYRSWQEKFQRNVLKGEKGIRILAPCPVKRTVTKDVYDSNHQPVLDSDGKHLQRTEVITIPAFKPVTVFDISQTDGEPLPMLAQTLTGNVNDYPLFLEALQRASGSVIHFEKLPPGMDGFFSLKDKTITIRNDMSEVQTICAMIHEITHSRLHDRDQYETGMQKDSKTMEVEAESVAYAVCAYYGIETGSNSFGYIASWSKSKELPELKKSLETITSASSDLIKDIERSREELTKLKDPVLIEGSLKERLISCKQMTEQQKPRKEACL